MYYRSMIRTELFEVGRFRAVHTPPVLTGKIPRDAGEAHACQRVLVL